MSAIFEESDFIDVESVVKKLRSSENKVNLDLDFICKNKTDFKWVFYVSGTEINLFELRLHSQYNLDLQDDFGYTTLMHSCANDCIEIAKQLIEMGANLDIQDHDGQTILMHACCINSIKMVAYILSWLDKN